MPLIDDLIKNGWLKSPAIIEAFRKIKRENFLPEGMKGRAEHNEALPIGWGQTISQPLTVAFLLEKLSPMPGDKILDVGSGSGWTSALLSEIVEKAGAVIGIEIVPELKEFGEKNAAKYGSENAKFVLADGSKGYPGEAPYDKILAGASAGKIPKAWKEQLKVGGRIVAPIGSSIVEIVKKSDNEFKETEYPGFVFVPLIEK